MTNTTILICKQTALGVKASQGQGTLFLYRDELVRVHSQAARCAGSAGFAVMALRYLIAPHIGPGALGALIGFGGGSMIGGAAVTVMLFDSISGLAGPRSSGIGGRLEGRSLLVMTTDGTACCFSVQLGKWSARLAAALAIRGSRSAVANQAVKSGASR